MVTLVALLVLVSAALWYGVGHFPFWPRGVQQTKKLICLVAAIIAGVAIVVCIALRPAEGAIILLVMWILLSLACWLAGMGFSPYKK